MGLMLNSSTFKGDEIPIKVTQQATPFHVRDPKFVGVRTFTQALPRYRVRLLVEVLQISAENIPIPS
jgi:hypothetical protein